MSPNVSGFYFLCLFLLSEIVRNNPSFVQATENNDMGRFHVTYLELPNHKYHCCALKSVRPILEIYCYRGKEKSFIHMWQTVKLECSLPSEAYEYYEGASPAEVITEFEVHRSSWKPDLFTYSWKEKVIRLSPFNTSCIGINTNSDDFDVTLKVTRVDFWRVALFVCAITLFLWAPKLGGNTLFFYICGIILGICSSLLILVFFISKMIPRGPLMYGFVLGGWTLGVCVIQLMYDNLRMIAVEYQSQVGMYIAATGLISFVVCYRMGPVTNPRSKNLIQWALQGASLIMIYLSSEFHEAIIVIVGVLLAGWLFGPSLLMYLKRFWYRRFPPQRRFLSPEEYELETSITTTAALEELRTHCASPDVNAWRYVARLRLPVKFADFMAGGSHLTDQEFAAHAVFENNMLDISDDEDSD